MINGSNYDPGLQKELAELRAENEALRADYESSRREVRRWHDGVMKVKAEKEALKTDLAKLKVGVMELYEQAKTHLGTVQKLQFVLHSISLGSYDSMTTKEDLGRRARVALGEET